MENEPLKSLSFPIQLAIDFLSIEAVTAEAQTMSQCQTARLIIELGLHGI